MLNKNTEVEEFHCWICDSRKLKMVKRSGIVKGLKGDSFAITDSNYGTTGEIYQCLDCGFLQCSTLSDVLSFYEDLEDISYEEGRSERSLQAKMLMNIIQKYQQNGNLLDIGAGSGILIEQALKMGYCAEGVEPSKWLQKRAEKHGLPVHLGTFPHPNLTRLFDIITLVDVLEHVSNPVQLMTDITKALAKDGIGIIVTPDGGSFAAQLMGWKWWHFRVAHIGYFNKKTLLLSLSRAGLQPIKIIRPSWFFTADYLFDRVNKYLPDYLRTSAPSSLKRIIVPLNLRDSLLVVFTNKG